MSEYRVELDAYNGPLDLLLFLIRKDEIDIYDIPLARVTEQYIQFVALIQQIDPNLVGDFLVMLASLLELKSRALLPRHLAVEGEDEEDFEDPRLELVRQLLAYKAFKDAAQDLGAAAQVQALRFPSAPGDLPKEGDDAVDLEDCNIWALMNAFAGLLEQTGKNRPFHEVVVDDTPISLNAADIVDSLERADGSQLFNEIFRGRNKPQMIGLFLALLELIRQRRVRMTQDQLFGPITLHLIDVTPIDEVADVDSESPFAEQADDDPNAESGSEVDEIEGESGESDDADRQAPQSENHA